MNIPIALNATNTFDEDDFDWGDDTPGITLADVHVDIAQEAVMAALRSNETAFGWTYLLGSDRKPTKGRVFRVKHFIGEEDRKFFTDNWPGYTFIWDCAVEHHDHPRSHLANELNEIEALEGWTKDGEVFLDMFGNPGRAKKYKRSAIILRNKNTAKDYIRHQYGDGRCVNFNMEALCDPKSTIGKVDRVFLNQALYYLTKNDIARILHTSERRVIKAVIHRHSQTWGELNGGEQEYRVSEEGIVEHINVRTGEKYVHPSLEAMFRQNTARTEFGGIAWTTRALGGDAFLLEFVGCPNELCEEYKPLQFLKTKSWEEYSYSNITVKKCLGWVWMTASTTKGVVKIEDLNLFNTLRRYAACKQRTPGLHTEMASLARRLTNKADIISIHGGGASDIPIASMADYVEVAKYIDMRHEIEIAVSMYKENVDIMGALNAYYATGALPADFTRTTKVVKKVTSVATKVAKGFVGDVSLGIRKELKCAEFGELLETSYTELGADAICETLQLATSGITGLANGIERVMDGEYPVPGGW